MFNFRRKLKVIGHSPQRIVLAEPRGEITIWLAALAFSLILSIDHILVAIVPVAVAAALILEIAPSTLTFQRGRLLISRRYLFWARNQEISADDIVEIRPKRWGGGYLVLRMKSGRQVRLTLRQGYHYQQVEQLNRWLRLF